MADETSVAAGKRFSRDMRLIREDRGISLDDIHKETRISRTLLESFEQGGLYEHPTFNEVYLRSFVRVYAEAIDIPTDAALEGLDAAQEGTYQKSLADQFIGRDLQEEDDLTRSESADPGVPGSSVSEESETFQQSSPPPTAGGPEGRGGIVGPPRAMGEESETTDVSEPDEESEESSPEEPPSQEQVSSEQETSPVHESPPSSSSSGAPTDRSDADETSPPTAETSPEPKKAPDHSEPDGESDPTPDSTGKDAPSWMDEESGQEGESPSTSAGAEEGAPASTFSEGGEGTPQMESPGETGIVGDPTAMGSDEAPADAARPGSSTASPESRSRRRSGWLRFFQGEQREIVWAGIGFVVILLVLVGLGIAYFSSTGTSKQTRQAEQTADTTASSSPEEDTTRTPDRPPPANITLGDSIYLTVVADNTVSGIRIQRDQDLQRPYWIEEGEAEVYPFRQRVTIENELQDVRLFLGGYPFPIDGKNATGQLVIDRSQVEAFVDTLRGTPTRLSVTPDTIPKGPPSTQ